MRLLISYNNVMKIFQNATSYTDMIAFIQKNFDKLPSKFIVQYRDSEGDLISLRTQSDINVMLDIQTSQYLKAYVNEDNSDNQEDDQKDEVQLTNCIQSFAGQQSEKYEKMEMSEPVTRQQKVLEKQEIAKQQKIKNHQQEKQQKTEKTSFSQLEFIQINTSVKSQSEQIYEEFNQHIEKQLIQKVQQIQNEKNDQPQSPQSSQSPQSKSFDFKGKLETSSNKPETKKPYQLDNLETRVRLTIQNLIPSITQMVKKQLQSEGGIQMVKMNQSANKQAKKEQNMIESTTKSSADHGRLDVIEKMFTLEEYFGGSPQQYREFVQKNLQLPIDWLLEGYKQQMMNGKVQLGSKLIAKTKKLGIYFEIDQSNFNDLVRQNPYESLSTLIQMYKLIKDDKISKQNSKEKQKQILNIKERQKAERVQKRIFSDNIKKNAVINQLWDYYGVKRHQQNKADRIRDFYTKNQSKSKDVIINLFKQEVASMKGWQPVNK